VSLAALGLTGKVKDLKFLEGYYEPTLLLLGERAPSCTLRFAATRHTNYVTAVSLNLAEQKQAQIWQVGGVCGG
jgi:hypothetical protein